MLMNLVEYYWAEDLDEALILLARPDIKTVPLAGGTYLLSRDDEEIQALVDLRELQLASIEEETRDQFGRLYLKIGAMATLQALADSAPVRSIATGILSNAALASSSSLLIRNSATLGGTLAMGSTSQADLLTALAVMDAEVLLRSASRAQIGLTNDSLSYPGLSLSAVTFKGKQERRVPYVTLNVDRRPQELITGILIPRLAPACGGSFMRVGRTATDVALLNAAALVEVRQNTYRRVRLALGGVNMDPVRLTSVEQQLEGQPVNVPSGQALDVGTLANVLQTGMSGFQPSSDFRASSGYRHVIGMNLAFRALEEATNVSRWHDMVSSEGRN